MAAGAEPVAAAEFDRLIARLGPFEPAPHVAIAVSGGRDSLALALLAGDWAAARRGRATGLIVDHGLRRGSAAEAAGTAALLRRHGIAAAILAAPDRPRRNLQAWARAARYAAMAAWCREAGALHLLVAHQRDDQAETLLAALARNPGPRGLAGMAAVRELASCRIVRPLLDVPRARLTATLQARQVAWIDDPWNRDRRFRRVRLRQALAAGGQGPELAARAFAAGPARQRFERLVAGLLAAMVALDGPSARIDRRALRRAEPEVAAAALGALVRWIGGRPAPPRQARLDRTAGWLRSAARRGRRTLGGCLIVLEEPGGSGLPAGAAAILAAEAERAGRRRERSVRPALAAASFGALPAAPAA